MDVDVFVAAHQASWARLETLVERADRPQRLTGAEVDAAIERVAAEKALDEERARHTDWERTCANASLF